MCTTSPSPVNSTAALEYTPEKGGTVKNREQRTLVTIKGIKTINYSWYLTLTHPFPSSPENKARHAAQSYYCTYTRIRCTSILWWNQKEEKSQTANEYYGNITATAKQRSNEKLHKKWFNEIHRFCTGLSPATWTVEASPATDRKSVV